MILEALSERIGRVLVPISDAELETLERDGPRALNYLSSRGIARTRLRILAISRTLLFLVFASYMWYWSGAGLLAFVVYGAVLTVLIDGMRQFLAPRWLFYSHSRVYRATEVLVTGSSLESGSTLRPQPRPRKPQLVTLGIAGAATLVGLPLVWFTLSRFGWASWDTVFANLFLPLCMLFIGIWRLVRGYLGILHAKGSSVGTRDLFLDSDDALDIYALALLLSLLLVPPFGAAALTWVAFLVVVLRLLAAIWLWWQQRRALALLQRRIYRTHPNAPASKSDWDEDEPAAGQRR